MRKKAIIALSAVATVGANGAAIHTGLVNYWALDGNGDDTASTMAPIVNTSTVNDTMTPGGTAGAATISATGGLFGGAVDFERGTGVDGRLAASQSVDVDFAGENMTTSIWVQFDDNSSGNWQSILVKGEQDNYRIATHRNHNSGTSNNNAAGVAGDHGDIHSGVNVRSTNWHHIVLTTVAGAGRVTNLYVDGALTGTATPATDIENEALGTPDELWIGNNVTDPDRMWDGLIDDVAQWDRTLTPAEITEIYNAGIAGTSLGAIPEPTSGLLLGLSGLLVVLRRRR